MKTLSLLLQIVLICNCIVSYANADIQSSSNGPVNLAVLMNCDLPPDVGPCDGAFPRYYYNTNSGTCEQFIYGGCGGNENNYMTFNLCIEACGNDCQLEPEVGPCQAAIPRYYYNTNSGTCELFVYGGCGGNANNYMTFNMCIEACGDDCQLEPEVGPCQAVIPRYYYNTNSGTCEQFVYGGCGGNDNNYLTFEMCMQACGDVCQLPAEVGPCDGAFPRYYYNTNSGTCEQFIYGGCNGNANNYLTFNLCIQACGDVCQLEPDVGPCDAALNRWYFNSTTGQCEPFTYGGCGGNANRYLSQALCMSACGDVCYLPPDPGPCQAFIPRFYFDPTTGDCRQFIWGGCGGNANNYSSYTMCMSTCAAPCDMPADQGPCLAIITRYFYNTLTQQLPCYSRNTRKGKRAHDLSLRAWLSPWSHPAEANTYITVGFQV